MSSCYKTDICLERTLKKVSNGKGNLLCRLEASKLTGYKAFLFIQTEIDGYFLYPTVCVNIGSSVSLNCKADLTSSLLNQPRTTVPKSAEAQYK